MTRQIRLSPPLISLAVLAILISGLQFGCGQSDGTLVARVGDEKITIKDFEEFLKQNARGYLSAEEEYQGKLMLLDSLINHRLLVQEARARHIDQSPEVARILEANRSGFLLDALYETKVGQKAVVTEAEVRKMYADLEFQIRPYQIQLNDWDTANMVFEMIKEGADFEEMAYQFSLDERAKRNRGDMGYFIRGSAPEEFEQVVFDLEIGEITPPFETPYGIHIVKMVDKRPNDARTGYSAMRHELEKQMLAARTQLIAQQFFDSIATKYPVTVDRDVADYVTHKRTVIYPPPVVAKLPKYDFDDDQLDRDEKELVLASWEGGEMTLIEYLIEVRRSIPAENRPTFEEYERMEQLIFQLKQIEIMVYEAERQKIPETEYFKHKMRLFEDYTAAEILKNDSLGQPEPPIEAEMRDYYDRHREEYLIPPMVRMFEIMLSDEMSARRLAAEIDNLDEFRTAAFRWTERAGIRVKYGDLGYCDSSRFPILFPAARKIPLNTVGGPIANRGKYSLIWPEQWMGETYQDYLTVKEDIAAELYDVAKDNLVLDWLAERRQEVDIEVYEDAVRSMIDADLYRTTDG